MSLSLLLAAVLVAPQLLRCETFPLSHPDAQVFLVRADSDRTGDVAALSGSTLVLYPSETQGSSITISLEPGTAAVDVADIDDDTHPEVVAVCGDRVLKYVLTPAQNLPPPIEVLRYPSIFATPGVEPVPRVLVVHRGGRTLLALPQKDSMELVALDGTVDSQFLCRPDHSSLVSGFSAHDYSFPVVSSGLGVEWGVGNRQSGSYDLPVDLQPGPEPFAWKRVVALPAAGGSQGMSGRWPSFPLRVMGEDSRRVRFLSPTETGHDTVIALESKERIAPPEGSSTEPIKAISVVGPEHRYPGVLIAPDGDLPDYNHDGYVDLTLWQAPEPGLSLDALARAASGGSWPLRIGVYLFSPDKDRFDLETAQRIDTDVPVRFYVTPGGGGPVRNCVLRDFNGDSYTDCGLSTAPNVFKVWLYKDGFKPEPDSVNTFPEPVTRVEFRADINGDGATNVGFRGTRAIYVLRLSQTSSLPPVPHD